MWQSDSILEDIRHKVLNFKVSDDIGILTDTNAKPSEVIITLKEKTGTVVYNNKIILNPDLNNVMISKGYNIDWEKVYEASYKVKSGLYGYGPELKIDLKRMMNKEVKADLDKLNLFSKTSFTHIDDLVADYRVNLEKYLLENKNNGRHLKYNWQQRKFVWKGCQNYWIESRMDIWYSFLEQTLIGIKYVTFNILNTNTTVIYEKEFGLLKYQDLKNNLMKLGYDYQLISPRLCVFGLTWFPQYSMWTGSQWLSNNYIPSFDKFTSGSYVSGGSLYRWDYRYWPGNIMFPSKQQLSAGITDDELIVNLYNLIITKRINMGPVFQTGSGTKTVIVPYE